MLIYAHRGISSLYPENSKIALEKVSAFPINGAEFDVELTKDKQAVLVHQETFSPDSTFQMLEQVAPSMQNRWVWNYTLHELKKLDSGVWFDKEYKGTNLSVLSEILSLDWSGREALIELKDPLLYNSAEPDLYHKEIVSAVKSDIENFCAAGNKAYILSFSRHVLYEALQQIPQVPRVVTSATFEMFEKNSKDTELQVYAYCVSETLVFQHPEVIETAHNQRAKLIVYEHTNYEKNKSREDFLAERREVWKKLSALRIDGLISNFAEEYSAT